MSTAPIKLPRLSARVRVSDQNGLGSAAFSSFWDQFASAIEIALNTAITANAAINLNAAYTVGISLASNPVDSTTANITISDHTLVYPDKSVMVIGGEIDGLAYNTQFFVYYDDPNRVGGAVVYHVATDGSAFPSSTNPFRHFVGAITTPANSGAGPTSGTGKVPGGYNGGDIP
jgi:hypothetical protein